MSPYISRLDVSSKLKTFCMSRLLAVSHGCWILLSLIYQHFFHIFASFFSRCSEFAWGLCFLIVLSVIYQTWLYDSNNWKNVSWCNFFSVWRTKTEIIVSRVSIICTILCSNVWFVWNHTRFGFCKTCKRYSGQYYGQFILFKYAILLYAQFMTFFPPYVTIYNLVIISCFFMLVKQGHQLGKVQGHLFGSRVENALFDGRSHESLRLARIVLLC